MPTAALSPCRTCKQVGCTTHTREAWQSSKPAPVKRRAGRWLQRERIALWMREPKCRSCHRDIQPQEMVRDHIIPLAEGGQDIDTNVQPLCLECSEKKTQAESARGAQRHRGA